MPIRTLSHRATKGITREIKETIDTSISGSIYENNPNFNKLDQSAATEPPGTYIHTFQLLDPGKTYVLLPDYISNDISKGVVIKTLLGGPIPIWTWEQCEKFWLSKIHKNLRNSILNQYSVIEFLLDLEQWIYRDVNHIKDYNHSSSWMAEKYYVGFENARQLSKEKLDKLLSLGRNALSRCVSWLLWATGFRADCLTEKMTSPGAKSDIFCRTSRKSKLGYIYNKKDFDLCRQQVVLVKNTNTRDKVRNLCIDEENQKIFFENELK